MSLLKITGLAAAAAALLSISPARADLLTSLMAAPTPTGDGFYAYTYDVTLSGGQLDATTTSSTGAVTPAQFGTVYDFGPMANSNGTPYLATSGTLATAFTFSFDATDPAASQTTPTDSASLTNVRFTYDGTTTLSAPQGGANIDLGMFTIYSPYPQIASPTLQYDGQTYKTTNNTIQGNVGFTSGPALPTAVPEPASLALLGMGLAGAGFVRRRAK